MDTAQTDQELLEREFNTSTLPIDEMLRGDKEQTGEKVPDYRARLEFHRILGKLLGFN